MNAATQIETLPAEIVPVRRFEMPDLSQHGMWLLPRLKQTYPHLNDRGVANWLQTIIYNNEYLFLFLPNGVALAQAMAAHTLSATPLIHERFVWVQNREDKAQLAAAADFYVEFHRWGKSHGAEVIIVEEMSDVPHDLIKERLGRLFTRQQVFARV